MTMTSTESERTATNGNDNNYRYKEKGRDDVEHRPSDGSRQDSISEGEAKFKRLYVHYETNKQC